MWHTGYGRNVGNSACRSAESSTVAGALASAMLLGALLSFSCRISNRWHICAKKEYDVGDSLVCDEHSFLATIHTRLMALSIILTASAGRMAWKDAYRLSTASAGDFAMDVVDDHR